MVTIQDWPLVHYQSGIQVALMEDNQAQCKDQLLEKSKWHWRIHIRSSVLVLSCLVGKLHWSPLNWSLLA